MNSRVVVAPFFFLRIIVQLKFFFFLDFIGFY